MWTKQFEALKSELSKQIGIIRCLSHHLPKAAMKKVINPMFTSKLQYVLEVFGYPTSQICKDKEEDAIIKKTAGPAQHGNEGSTRYRRQGQDFMQQTPQLDRHDISWRDVPEGCVTGSKNPYWHGD
jgi:hypothetical protein